MSKILENKCKEELKNVEENHKRLLLHSCCAPCSSHVITYLAPYFDITILYYNPNIAPEDEYLKRKNEQIKLLNMLETPNKLDFIDCVLQRIGDVEFDTTGDDQELTLTLTIDYAFFTFNKEEKTKKEYDRLLRNTIVSENQDKFKEE